MNFDTHILAFWPHPDDVEIWCSGVLYKTSREWKKNVIIDLTPSQLSTNGTPEQRLKESMQAAKILGVSHRENMMLEDGNICDNCIAREEIATKIRKYRPEIILLPRWEDRHPDHECAAQLVKNAVFYAGLQKIELHWLKPHKPRIMLHYMIRNRFEPDLIISLDENSFERKLEAFAAYRSQKETNWWWDDLIKSRHIIDGHAIWSKYWEWYKLYSHGIWVENFDSVSNWFF